MIIRRSFLARVVGASVLAPTLARAQTSDSDPTDPAGRGRVRYTDGDSGSNADPAGQGRGPRREQPSGVSDSDMGSASDAGNHGRGRVGERLQTGVTDGDVGASADAAGRGQGGRPPQRSGATDSDPGDRPGFGRRLTPLGQAPKQR